MYFRNHCEHGTRPTGSRPIFVRICVCLGGRFSMKRERERPSDELHDFKIDHF